MKKILFISLVLGLILQFYYFNNLPQIVAHIFTADGIAKAGLAKKDYLLYSTMALVANSVICLTADTVCRKIPSRFISFPYNKYWQSQERRDAAFTKMAGWTNFFGLLINFFLCMLFFIIFLANTAIPRQLEITFFFTVIIFFFLVMACWLTALILAFKPPEKDME